MHKNLHKQGAGFARKTEERSSEELPTLGQSSSFKTVEQRIFLESTWQYAPTTVGQFLGAMLTFLAVQPTAQ